MDKLSEEFLKEYLYTHTYGKYADYDFNDLYKIYVSLTVKSKQDLINSPKLFRDFVMKNIKLMRVSSHIEGDTILKSLHQFTNVIDAKLRSAFRIANSEFADMVKELSPSKDASILDVGAGEIPVTSIHLAEMFDSVTSMDNAFMYTPETLQHLNIDPRFQYFYKDTPVSEFDFVVGKYPCSAIVPMITQCVKEGKPYLIKLCGHDVPSKRPGYREDWREGWKETLPEIDEYIQFFDEYAYNLGTPNAPVQKIIEEHEARIPPVQKQNYKPNFSTALARNFRDFKFIETEREPGNSDNG